ncbi:MAG: hypothetical protein JSU57_00085 [Candidatus Heimdallarchaeota archaeon]|nr:MAG: hypothetical protein JSU57_00085 [Candidatus Heimdallarchaeota archaeon]
MKEFNEIRKTCIYRDNQRCTYWPKETQCHFIACPLFSYKLSEVTKKGVKKRITDSVVFNIDDFDRASTTTLDLIEEVRTSVLSRLDHKEQKVQGATIIKKPVQRMTCIVCGELIDDDKFSTIRDPSGVIIYIHSKGKCQARKEQILAIREEWLNTHLSDN